MKNLVFWKKKLLDNGDTEQEVEFSQTLMDLQV